MEEKTILYQDVSIHYRVTGKGKTVLLLHGFGEDGNVWDKQIAALQNQFSLIIPDIPGSGKSALLTNATIDTYSEVVKAVIDKEVSINGSAGIAENISMIGHSMGGYITLAFAEKYPDYLQSLGLFHSAAFADNEEKIETRKKAIQFLQANGAHAFLKTSTPGLFTKAFITQYPAVVDELIEQGKNFSPEALIQYYEAMIARPDRTAVLKSFKGPVLFILGEHDTAIPLQSGLEQCHLPDRSNVHILKQSAHMGMWEETDKANKILIDFLK